MLQLPKSNFLRILYTISMSFIAVPKLITVGLLMLAYILSRIILSPVFLLLFGALSLKRDLDSTGKSSVKILSISSKIITPLAVLSVKY